MSKEPVEYLKHIRDECSFINYMGVNYFIVWDVVKNKIPELYVQIVDVLENQ